MPRVDLVNTKGTKTLFGSQAIEEVTRLEGPLTKAQEAIIEDEGYVNGFYDDDVGVKTGGVGQTGKFLKMSFKESFAEKEDVARKLFTNYDKFGEEIQAAVMSAVYRGDAKASFKWVKLMNQGRFDEAAEEFLDHDELRERKSRGNDGVVKRMERISNIVRTKE